MLSHHEYLVRERTTEAQRHAREARVARELSARRRWHRVAQYAQAAETRHARRLHRADVR
ncbi:hypothetical protein [Jatrophihabitans endophyticus]|uniref:hypothetical protein n=1 Tax=Jatrophihabitans endophyticus TaxID=1206085 RepID=UPI0019F4B387|nr:hypothetical protein [Jatrophihabitans endophyticus]MBE7187975.1 hypothetical protein [Jatrophihabitans endophyticus]